MIGPGEKTFAQFWRELKAAGWTSRRPTGIRRHHRYVMPGVKGRQVESRRDIDFFVGEEEVMAFGRKIGLLALYCTDSIPEAAVSQHEPVMATVPVALALSVPETASQSPSHSQPSAEEQPAAAEAVVEAASIVVEMPVLPPVHQTMAVTSSSIHSEEEKEEEPRDEDRDDASLDEFDCDQFIDAMRSEKLFSAIAEDDVNLSDDSFGDNEEVESMSDEIEAPDIPADYASDEESDSDLEDESSQFEQDDEAMRAMSASGDLQVDGADDLYDGAWGPAMSATAYAHTPLGMFFYFLPKKLWFHIAQETEAYRVECIPSIAEKQRARQLEAQAKDHSKTVQPLEELVEKLKKTKSITAHEILHVVALLIARSLCRHTDGLDKHWQTEEDGAIPRGTFNRYMTHKGFETITRYLHFARNSTGSSSEDKAWNVRPVLQASEKTFRRGYRLGPRISFDEGTIPNRSKFNPVRVYNKDKPHKYGTKVYMACCANSRYCSRIEVYIGASQESKTAQTAAQRKAAKTKAKGVAQKAVIRNVMKALAGQPGKCLIIADNFYTSCALALALLNFGCYYVGTHRNDRLGWPSNFAFTQAKRPKSMARGTYRIAQSKEHPSLIAPSWMDSKPVSMIATGCGTTPASVTRKEKGSVIAQVVPCPQIVADYHGGMGEPIIMISSDFKDTPSSTAWRSKKYYRQLFLGFVDMAVVNGFIIHKMIMKKEGKKVPTHAEHMRRLHVELLGVTANSLHSNMSAEDLVSAPIPTRSHTLQNQADYYTGNGQHKRRQHLCKVCSAMAQPKTKGFEISFYCQRYTDFHGGYVPLCNCVRRKET